MARLTSDDDMSINWFFGLLIAVVVLFACGLYTGIKAYDYHNEVVRLQDKLDSVETRAALYNNVLDQYTEAMQEQVDENTRLNKTIKQMHDAVYPPYGQPEVVQPRTGYIPQTLPDPKDLKECN